MKVDLIEDVINQIIKEGLRLPLRKSLGKVLRHCQERTVSLRDEVLPELR